MDAGAGEAGGVNELYDPEADYRKLYNHCVGFAMQMLADKQAFYPFGAKINADGSLGAVGANSGEQHPAPDVLLEILTAGLSEEVLAGKIRACCLCFDGKWQSAKDAAKSDVIMCIMEHRAENAMQFVVPYSVTAGAAPTIEQPIARRLMAKNFPWSASPGASSSQ